MGDWQPYAPDTIGPSWFPRTVGAHLIDTASKAYAWRFTAGDNWANVAELWLPARAANVLQPGRYLAELYDSGDEVVGDTTTSVYRPTADLVNTGPSWQTNAGGTANLYQRIDEATLATSDWITYDGRGTQKRRYGVNFGGLAAWPSGRRITAMRLHFVADCQKNSMLLRPWFYEGGSGVYTNIGPGVTVGTEQAEYSVELGEISPETWSPWIVSNVQNIAAADGFGLRPYNGKATEFRVYQLWLEVDWVTENRLEAYTLAGAGDNVDGTALWYQLGVVDLAGSNPALVAGDDYVVLLRRIPGSFGDVGSVGFTTLDSGDPLPTGWETFAVQVEGDGCLRAALDGFDITPAVPLLIAGPSGSWSPDGQPYQYLPSVPVDTTSTARQQITTAGGGGDYRLLRFMLALDPDAVAPNAELTAGVYDVATNTLQGSLESFAYDDLLELDVVGVNDTGHDLRVVERRMLLDSTLADATQYYVEWASDADNGPSYYVVLGTIDATGADPDADAGEATFGGLVDVADLVDLGGDQPAADLFATLSTIPAAPDNFTGELVDLQVDYAGPDGACTAITVDYALLHWSATALGGDFARYEIERSDDALGWVPVASITTEAAVEWRDIEARVGEYAQYRLRVVRAGDLISSDWAQSIALARQGVTDGPDSAWLFVSNEAPELACAYDHDPTTKYDFPDVDGVKLVDLYQRDGQVRFVETEQRLDEFDLELNIYTAASPTSTAPIDGPGRRVFDPLLAIAGQGSTGYPGTRRQLSYTCVLDPNGNRWLADVAVPTAEHVEPFYQHAAKVRVRELTKSPSVVDVELTGPLVLRRRAAWWIDTHGDFDALASSLPDLIGDNDATFVGADDTDAVPLPLSFTGQSLWSPGFDDMYLETPAVADLLTGDVLEVRWRASLGNAAGTGGDDSNCVLHQGSDQNSDVSWGIFWNNDTGDVTFRWSEDGTTVQTITAQTPLAPGIQSDRNRAARFYLTTGDFEVYEQPFASTVPDFAAQLETSAWTLVDTTTGSGATSLYASTAPIRHSASTENTTGDKIDGIVCTGYGYLVQFTLAAAANGQPLLDIDWSAVDVDALVWEHVTGLPPLGGSGTSEAEVATVRDYTGNLWQVYNWLTGSMPCAFVTRDAVLLGSHTSLQAGPDDAVFDRADGDDLSFVLGYRWTRNHIIGRFPAGHKIGDLTGIGDGWAVLQSSSLGGGMAGCAADGAAVVADVSTQHRDGRPQLAGFVIDGDADTLESYTNGVGTGSPASLAALGSQQLADWPMTIGVLLDAMGDVYSFAGFELFYAAVVRGTLSDDEWAALNDYNIDPTATPDDYTPTRYTG